jgi:serine/threonine-protein kinase
VEKSVKDKLFDGKYKIIKHLGKGGMSTVFLAENIRLGTKWAIKAVRKDIGKKNNLLAEPNILKNLKHVALPRIIDIINSHYYIYIVEDYIEGTPLNDILKNKGKFSEKEVIEIAKQLCNVLHYLHTQKPNPIIYRDMKPGNIILSKDGKVKLIDFGIAREYKKEAVSDTIALGTKGYAAPEQHGKSQTDARTDIYSLGITLYHLITGISPYDPPYETRLVREFDKNLSEGIEYIISKCVKKDPNERYQSIEHLLNDLNNIHRFNSEYKKVRRRSIITTAVITIIVLMVGFITYEGYLEIGHEKVNAYNKILDQGKKLEGENKVNEAMTLFNNDNNRMPDRIDGYKEISKLYLKQMQYDKCIDYIENKVFTKSASFQNDADMQYILGTAQFEKNDYESSELSFEKAKEINPNEVDYYRDLAVSYARQNKFDLAESIIKDIKEKGLNDSVTSYISGEIYEAKNDYNSAISMYEKCIKDAKSEEVKRKAFISIAEVYRDHPDQINDSASKEVDILECANSELTEKNDLIIQEMLGEAYFNKANTYIDGSENFKDNLEKSLSKFNMLSDNGIKDSQLYSNLGVIYEYLGQYDKSEACYLEMKKLDSNDIHSYLRLALLYIEMGNKGIDTDKNYKKAKECYNYIIKNDPNGINDPDIGQLVNLMRNF